MEEAEKEAELTRLALSSEDRDLAKLIKSIGEETILDSARTAAEVEAIPMLIVYGPIPATGYIDESHRDTIELVSLTQRQGCAKTVVYRVLRRELVGQVLDELEDHGGYRASMVEPNGDIAQGYQL